MDEISAISDYLAYMGSLTNWVACIFFSLGSALSKAVNLLLASTLVTFLEDSGTI